MRIRGITDRDHRAPSWPLLGALLVGVLAIGVVVGTTVGGAGGTAEVADLESQGSAPVAAAVVADAPPAPTAGAAPGPAEDPAGAVSGFLTAEATRDLETAFTYLVPDEQEVFRTPAAYVAEHADLLGTVTGFAVGEVTPDPADPDRATVVADVGFQPSLDTVMGLVPARATVTFPVVSGPDGWGLSLAGAIFEPVLPSDDQAHDDAVAIAEVAAACEAPPSSYGGDLVGQPVLLADLCGTDGPVTVTEVASLDDPLIVPPFLSAFGPEVGLWARVVSITAPTELRLVLAPYGDTWTLIGVLPPQT